MNFHIHSAAALAAVLALAPLSPVGAQRGACVAPSTILIGWPRVPDARAARELRDKVASEIKDKFRKEICIVDKEQADRLLSGSRYPTDSALPVRDWIQLATMLRADEVLELAAKPVGKGWEVSGRLTLVRDESLRDSLPAIPPVENIGQGARQLTAALGKVRAMLAQETNCYRAGREGKYAEAEAAGRAALAAYPGNIARLCLATALRQQKKNPAEVIALSDEVRRRDRTNALALLNLLNTYYEQQDTAKYAEVGTTMISLDPASPFAETIIANLASWKMTDVALKLVAQSLADNPDNVNLRQIEFRLLYSSDHLEDALAKGEALAKFDTSAVDTAFTMRMASGYVRDSQPAKAAEWLTAGTQKWPDNVQISHALAQIYRQTGEISRAIDEYKRILRFNPDETRGTRLFVARAYNELGQQDSAIAWVRRAAAAGDDKAQASGVVLAMGLGRINAAQQSKATDDWRAAMPILAFADTLNPEDRTAGFYLGVAAFQVAAGLYTSMQTQPTCETAREVRDLLLMSNDKVRAGATLDQQTQTIAPQILTGFGQLLPAVDDVIAQMRCQTPVQR